MTGKSHWNCKQITWNCSENVLKLKCTLHSYNFDCMQICKFECKLHSYNFDCMQICKFECKLHSYNFDCMQIRKLHSLILYANYMHINDIQNMQIIWTFKIIRLQMTMWHVFIISYWLISDTWVTQHWPFQMVRNCSGTACSTW